MTDAELKRLRELSEAKHLDGCSGFGKRCKACEFNSIARLAVPKLLDEAERLGQENVGLGIALNDVGANAERFRASNYELEDLVHTRRAERDEARAEEKRLLLENAAVLDDVERLRRNEWHKEHCALVALWRALPLPKAAEFAASDLPDESLGECTCYLRDRDEARAEVERLRKRIQQERVEHQVAHNGMTEYHAALVDIVAKIGGRPEGEGPLEDEYARFAIMRAHKALSE